MPKYDIWCRYTIEAKNYKEAEFKALNEDRMPLQVEDIIAHDDDKTT